MSGKFPFWSLKKKSPKAESKSAAANDKAEAESSMSSTIAEEVNYMTRFSTMPKISFVAARDTFFERLNLISDG